MRLASILFLLALAQGTEVVLGYAHRLDVPLEPAVPPTSSQFLSSSFDSSSPYVGKVALGSREFRLVLDSTVSGVHFHNSPFSPDAEVSTEKSSVYSSDGVLGLGQSANLGTVLGHTSFMLHFGEEKKLEFSHWSADSEDENVPTTDEDSENVRIQCNTEGPLWEFKLAAASFGKQKLRAKSGYIDVKSTAMLAPWSDLKVIQTLVCEGRGCMKDHQTVGFACESVPQDLPQLTFTVEGASLTLSPSDYIQSQAGHCQLMIFGFDSALSWAFGQPFLAAYALQFETKAHAITAYGQKNLRKRRKSSGGDLLFLLLILLWIVEFAIYHPWIFLITVAILSVVCYGLYLYQKAKDNSKNELKEPLLMEPNMQPNTDPFPQPNTQPYPPPGTQPYPPPSSQPYPELYSDQKPPPQYPVAS